MVTELWPKVGSASLFGARQHPGSRPGSSIIFAEVAQRSSTGLVIRGPGSVSEADAYAQMSVRDYAGSIPARCIWGYSSVVERRWSKDESEVRGSIPCVPTICLCSSRLEHPVLTGRTAVKLGPQAFGFALGESVGVMTRRPAGSNPVEAAMLVLLNISKRSPTSGRRVAETSGTRRMIG